MTNHLTPDFERIAVEKINAFITSQRSSPREALYRAQELWERDETGEGRDNFPDYLSEDTTPEELSRLAVEALGRAGWSCDQPPVFILDVPDEDALDRTGWHDGSDHTIQLHPKLLTVSTFPHELPHWVDNREGNNHGPVFCANFVGLVRDNMGQDFAHELLSRMRECDVDVDEGRLA